MAYLSSEKRDALAAEHEVEPERIEEWYAAFGIFDKNGDGKISIGELLRIMRDLMQDPTERELKEMIAEVDDNNTGTIEFPEFCTQMKRKYKDPDQVKDELIQAFKVFDKDQNNFISAEELSNVMKTIGEPLSPKEVQEMMDSADVDGDGKINYEEFAAIMMKKD